MPRKLVRLERVKEVVPIEKAESVEAVKILGWQSVVKKGQFKPGDFCIYHEIDSFLPIEPRYEFLRSSSYKKMQTDDGGLLREIEGFKLRTVKLCGQLSQGLALPLSDFPEITEDMKLEGTDVTGLLHVILYEKYIPPKMRHLVKGALPSFIKKTDQERVQNIHKEDCLKLKDVSFEKTEKIDGTSASYYQKGGSFGICGHGQEMKEVDGDLYTVIAKKYRIKEALEETGRNIAIQGEIAGSGIQDNPLCLADVHFYVYDVWDIDEQRYMLPADRQKMILLDLVKYGLEHVPVLSNIEKPFYGTTEYFDTDVNKIVKASGGKSVINPIKNREGVVYKSTSYVDGQSFSFKVIDNKGLLKEE